MTVAERRATAARLVQEAFSEVMRPKSEMPLLEPPSAVALMTEAVPLLEDEVEPVDATPSLPRPVVPFDRRYGRKLNRGY